MVICTEELAVKDKDLTEKDEYIKKLSISVRAFKREIQVLKSKLEIKEERVKTGKVRDSSKEIEVKNLTSMVNSMKKDTDCY